MSELAPAPVIGMQDRVAVVAKTRSGKSVWVRACLRGVRTRIVFVDPKDEITWPDAHKFRGPDRLDLRKRVNVYVPRDPADMEETDRVFRAVFAERDLTLALDESYPITNANKAPRHLRLILIQGAARNQRVLACMQRPVHVEPNLLAQASHIIVFHRGFRSDDCDALAAYMGGVTAKELRSEIAYIRRHYGDYSYLHYDEHTHTLHRRPRIPDWMMEPGV